MSDWKGGNITITTQAAQDRENARVTCLMSWVTAMVGCNPFKKPTRRWDKAVYGLDLPGGVKEKMVAESRAELETWLDKEAEIALNWPGAKTGEEDTLRHQAGVLDDILLSGMHVAEIECLEQIFYGIFKANRGE